MASKKELEERIRKLENQVLKDKVSRWFYIDEIQEPTLKGRVDAIIKHLGIEIAVKNSESKVIAREVKK